MSSTKIRGASHHFFVSEINLYWKNRSRLGQCAGADWDTFDAAKLMIFSETVAF